MSKTRYELKPGVNRVSIGTIVVDEHGYATDDPVEIEALDENPDVVKATEKHSAKGAS